MLEMQDQMDNEKMRLTDFQADSVYQVLLHVEALRGYLKCSKHLYMMQEA